MMIKKKTRIAIGTLGFSLPLLAISVEILTRLVLSEFKLPALLTPVLFIGPPVIFGLMIFSSAEMKILNRIGLFVGTVVLYAIQIILLGFALLMFTGLEGMR